MLVPSGLPSSDSSSLIRDTPLPLLPKKRLRASKPKVRSGCITCKIRRIKCDEEKPACKRCTSTGRSCDGYGAVILPKPHETTALGNIPSSHSIPLKSRVRVQLLPLKTLLAGVSGDATERFYFHRFREIAEDAVGVRHTHNSVYWKHAVPQYCHQIDSVKHAYIAFGAAYHNFQIEGSQPDKSRPPSEAEKFIIRQYNTAMTSISKDIQELPIRRQYGVIFVCCVAFFCIEVLRNEWEAALTHLSNGLRLMSNLPDEVAQLFKDPLKGNQAVDTSYARVTYMLKLLSRWETSASFLSSDRQPCLTLAAYESRKLHPYLKYEINDVTDLRDAVNDLCQDASVFRWQAKHHIGDVDFWQQRIPHLQHSILQQRVEGLTHIFEKYLVAQPSLKVKAHGYTSIHVSMLQLQCTSWDLDMLSIPSSRVEPLSPQDLSRLEGIILTAEAVRYSINASRVSRSTQVFNADLGVVPMLQLVAKTCRDQEIESRIFQLIKEWPRWENLWDDLTLKQIEAG